MSTDAVAPHAMTPRLLLHELGHVGLLRTLPGVKSISIERHGDGWHTFHKSDAPDTEASARDNMTTFLGGTLAEHACDPDRAVKLWREGLLFATDHCSQEDTIAGSLVLSWPDAERRLRWACVTVDKFLAALTPEFFAALLQDLRTDGRAVILLKRANA